jgi:hypothetical protein
MAVSVQLDGVHGLGLSKFPTRTTLKSAKKVKILAS